jgi:hypothetical protein
MLSSITPLGERARRQRWWLTVAFYLAGSVSAGICLGALLGLAGSVVHAAVRPASSMVAGATGVLALAAALIDLVSAPFPTVHRQVNEDWLRRYRGWVYGLGYGMQLGLGVVTIVTSTSVYLVLAIAVLSGAAIGDVVIAVVAGGLICGWFGLIRALPLVVYGHARDVSSLVASHRSISGKARPAAALTVISVAIAGIVLLVAAVQ